MRSDAEGTAREALPFPVVFDKDSALAHAFGHVSATPTTILIDTSGKVVSRTVGIINFDKLHAFLASALVPHSR